MNLTSCQIEDAELDNTELVKNFIEITYNYGNGFRTRNQECLFLAKDVANWIEHSNVSMMLNKIDDEEKELIQIGTSNNAYSAWFLTEDGLYEVLMLKKIE
ncbi:BRO family protein [Clostridium paraputrificum]|uniref:BRO family protein n=1 Tax=Clostridium paraputrificum TaxID=29363 RepID=UPI003F6320C7